MQTNIIFLIRHNMCILNDQFGLDKDLKMQMQFKSVTQLVTLKLRHS